MNSFNLLKLKKKLRNKFVNTIFNTQINKIK